MYTQRNDQHLPTQSQFTDYKTLLSSTGQTTTENPFQLDEIKNQPSGDRKIFVEEEAAEDREVDESQEVHSGG